MRSAVFAGLIGLLAIQAACEAAAPRERASEDEDDAATAAKFDRGVCRFGEADELRKGSAEGSYEVPAKHPLLAYSGRVDCEHPEGVSMGFPGASVHVRFVGTGVKLRLQDHGKGTKSATNYYDVKVDGELAMVLEVSPDEEWYTLAEELDEGEHEVALLKRVEASPQGALNAGRAEVLGFELQGSKLLQARLPTRRLEFIGDSITCGYGNELETVTPDMAPYTSKNQNANSAYGALVASLLDAQYSAVAYSGRGMSQNIGNGAWDTLPEMYLSTNPDDAGASRWEPSQYVPAAVVINLGTNDFSNVDIDREKFVSTYVEFLEQLRAYYPEAALVAAVGPMLSDYYPEGAMAWTNAQADVQAAVDARTEAGDMNVHYFAFAPQASPYGEDWHPTNATHARMAEELTPLLEEVLQW